MRTTFPDAVSGDPLAAVHAADDLHAELSDAWYTASFAPPPSTFAKCVCGSTFEIRGSQINVTAEESSAAGNRLADLFGRGPLAHLDAQIVATVIAAINHERASADYDALRDWEAGHELCGED